MSPGTQTDGTELSHARNAANFGLITCMTELSPTALAQVQNFTRRENCSSNVEAEAICISCLITRGSTKAALLDTSKKLLGTDERRVLGLKSTGLNSVMHVRRERQHCTTTQAQADINPPNPSYYCTVKRPLTAQFIRNSDCAKYRKILVKMLPSKTIVRQNI